MINNYFDFGETQQSPQSYTDDCSDLSKKCIMIFIREILLKYISLIILSENNIDIHMESEWMFVLFKFNLVYYLPIILVICFQVGKK